MARKKTSNKQVSIEAYSHKGKKRTNNPPVGLVSSQTDKLNSNFGTWEFKTLEDPKDVFEIVK